MTRIAEEQRANLSVSTAYFQNGHIMVHRALRIRVVGEFSVRLRAPTIHRKSGPGLTKLLLGRGRILQAGTNHFDHRLIEEAGILMHRRNLRRVRHPSEADLQFHAIG